MTAQTTIDFSRTARDKGISKAIRHADAVHDSWSEKAFGHLRTFVAQQTGEFLAEDFRAWCIGLLPSPPHNRAFGGVIKRAVTAGLITKVRIDQVKNVKAHMANANVWRKA